MTPSLYTCKELADWIEANRDRGNGTKRAWPRDKWTYWQIVNHIYHGSLNGLFHYVADTKIRGVCTITLDQHTRTLRVTQIIADRVAMRAFVDAFRKRHPGWSLAIKRNGREIHFTPQQTERVILSYER